MVLLIGLEPIRILLRGILRLAQQALSQHIVYFIANKAQYIVVSVGCPQMSEST